MSQYMTELFYGKPEPVWVINNRRRHLGGSSDPYYGTSAPNYSSTGEFGPYTRGGLLPDVQIKATMYDMTDVARIKDALGVEGVYNVVCDIPEQVITVSSNLSPRTIVSLVRQVISTAHIINVVDPYSSGSASYRPYPSQPPFSDPLDRTRYSSYDDSYGYAGRTGYTPAYTAPYNGRSYDNEFRPARYGGSYSSFY